MCAFSARTPCLMASDVYLAGGLGATEEKEYWEEMKASIQKGWLAILENAGEMRLVWAGATAKVRERRAAEEAARGVMRLLMRAWREIVDAVPAGAAQWDQRWAAGRGCQLGRRLVGMSTRVHTDEHWQVRWLLEWQRLVAAGEVQARRKRSPAWLAHERQWRRLNTMTGWPGASEDYSIGRGGDTCTTGARKNSCDGTKAQPEERRQ